MRQAFPDIRLQNLESQTAWEALFYKAEGGRFGRSFEIYTQEYISRLAQRLQEDIQKLGSTQEHPLTILEVGAENGRLAYLLREEFKARGVHVRYVAVDDGSWVEKEGVVTLDEEDFRVETLTNAVGMQRYQPALVISSWMPRDEDWTEEFRRCISLQEDVLIGVRGACGTFATWWNTLGLESDFVEPQGWEREDLTLTQYQLNFNNIVSKVHQDPEDPMNKN